MSFNRELPSFLNDILTEAARKRTPSSHASSNVGEVRAQRARSDASQGVSRKEVVLSGSGIDDADRDVQEKRLASKFSPDYAQSRPLSVSSTFAPTPESKSLKAEEKTTSFAPYDTVHTDVRTVKLDPRGNDDNMALTVSLDSIQMSLGSALKPTDNGSDRMDDGPSTDRDHNSGDRSGSDAPMSLLGTKHARSVANDDGADTQKKLKQDADINAAITAPSNAIVSNAMVSSPSRQGAALSNPKSTKRPAPQKKKNAKAKKSRNDDSEDEYDDGSDEDDDSDGSLDSFVVSDSESSVLDSDDESDDSDTDASNIAVNRSRRRGRSKPVCQYDGMCYRQNALHWRDFDHPSQPNGPMSKSSSTPSSPQLQAQPQQQVILNSPTRLNRYGLSVCQYGASCYQKNPTHRSSFYHPGRNQTPPASPVITPTPAPSATPPRAAAPPTTTTAILNAASSVTAANTHDTIHTDRKSTEVPSTDKDVVSNKEGTMSVNKDETGSDSGVAQNHGSTSSRAPHPTSSNSPKDDERKEQKPKAISFGEFFEGIEVLLYHTFEENVRKELTRKIVGNGGEVLARSCMDPLPSTTHVVFPDGTVQAGEVSSRIQAWNKSHPDVVCVTANWLRASLRAGDLADEQQFLLSSE